MPQLLRRSFASLCRETRIGLDVTQQELADAAGVTRGYVAMVEGGRANPSLALVERISDALGLELRLVGQAPITIGRERQRDLVHARCSSYVERRLRKASFAVAREVELVHGRMHGWVDLLAFDGRTGTLFIVEIKTRLDDLGAVERQLGWYERRAFHVARELGWEPRRLSAWLLLLASDEVDAAIRDNRDALQSAFPIRAAEMLALFESPAPRAGRGLALSDYADAASRFTSC